MKRVFAVFSMVALLILAGCEQAPEQAIRKMRLEQKTVFNQSRLFSTVGFWVLDEPVRQKVMACYAPGGALNRATLRAKFPEATLAEEQGCTLVTLGSGTVPVFVLADGPIIALDPASDEMVHRLAQDYAHDGKTVPVVGK